MAPLSVHRYLLVRLVLLKCLFNSHTQAGPQLPTGLTRTSLPLSQCLDPLKLVFGPRMVMLAQQLRSLEQLERPQHYQRGQIFLLARLQRFHATRNFSFVNLKHVIADIEDLPGI